MSSAGYWRNQRWPPCSRGRASQVTASACRRPPGSSTRYCCRGATPKVYLTSKSASCAVGPVGADHPLAVALRERRRDALEGVGRVVEVTEYRLAARMLHRDGVLRLLPGLRLGGVALRTCSRTGVLDGSRARCGRRPSRNRRLRLRSLAPLEDIPCAQRYQGHCADGRGQGCRYVARLAWRRQRDFSGRTAARPRGRSPPGRGSSRAWPGNSDRKRAGTPSVTALSAASQ